MTDAHKVRTFTNDEVKRFVQTAKGHRLYTLWAVALAKTCEWFAQ